MKILSATHLAVTWGLVGAIAGLRLGATVGALGGAVVADALARPEKPSEAASLACAAVGGLSLAVPFGVVGAWCGAVGGGVAGVTGVKG